MRNIDIGLLVKRHFFAYCFCKICPLKLKEVINGQRNIFYSGYNNIDDKIQAQVRQREEQLRAEEEEMLNRALQLSLQEK